MNIKSINEEIKNYVIKLIGSNNDNREESIIYKYIDTNLGLNNINTDGIDYKQVDELFKNINIELHKIKEISNFDDFNFLYEIFKTILNIYLFFLGISDFSIKNYKITSNQFYYKNRHLRKDFNHLLNILDYNINKNSYQAKMNKLYKYDLVRADYEQNSVKNVFEYFIDKYTEFVKNLFEKLSNLLNHKVFKKYGLSNITKYIEKDDYLNKYKVKAKNLIIDTLISEYLNINEINDDQIKFILNLYAIPFSQNDILTYAQSYKNFIKFLSNLKKNGKLKSEFKDIIKSIIQKKKRVIIPYCGIYTINYQINENLQISFTIKKTESEKCDNENVIQYIYGNIDNPYTLFGKKQGYIVKHNTLEKIKKIRDYIYEYKLKLEEILQIIEPINYKIGNIISLLENCK
jgi:hypothetical protein